MSDPKPRRSVIPGWSGDGSSSESEQTPQTESTPETEPQAKPDRVQRAKPTPQAKPATRPRKTAGSGPKAAARPSRPPHAPKRPRQRHRRLHIQEPEPAPPLIHLDIEDHDRTVWDRIRSMIPDLQTAVILSLAAHAVFLFLFFFGKFAVRTEESLVFDASWLAPTDEEGQRIMSGEDGDSDSTGVLRLTSDAGTVRVSRRPQTQEEKPQEGVQVVGEAVDPVNVDGLFATRQRRNQVREQGEAGEKLEQAINLGLYWLRSNQNSDGSWSLHEGFPDAGYAPRRTKTGATALALLCFLGDGHTHLTGEHAEIVRGAIDFLIGIQSENGDLYDFKREQGRFTHYYAHSLATTALLEAYVMTGDTRLRDPIERAVGFLVRSQQPVRGGWRYQPMDEKSIGDLSVTAIALNALQAARAAGLEVPESALQLGMAFLGSVSSEDGSRYRYRPDRGEDAFSPAMTAAGLVSRQYLGWDREHFAMQSGLDYLTNVSDPSWDAGARNLYEWFYITEFLFNMQGPEWEQWYARVQKTILDGQQTAGLADRKGSWRPWIQQVRVADSFRKLYGADAEHASQGGRLYVTCLSLLILETPYRHKPLFEAPAN